MGQLGRRLDAFGAAGFVKHNTPGFFAVVGTTNSSHSISNASWQLISFGGPNLEDSAGSHSIGSSQFFAKTAGRLIIMCYARWTGVAEATSGPPPHRGLEIYRNGMPYSDGWTTRIIERSPWKSVTMPDPGGITIDHQMNIKVPVRASLNDYFQLYAYQAGPAGSRDLAYAEFAMWLESF